MGDIFMCSSTGPWKWVRLYKRGKLHMRAGSFWETRCGHLTWGDQEFFTRKPKGEVVCKNCLTVKDRWKNAK